MEIFALWLLGSVVVGIIASHRGRGGFEWFVTAAIFTPVLMGILLMCIPNKANAVTPETHVNCPDCAEPVRAEARVCKHCGCKLVPTAAAQATTPATGATTT